MNRNKFEQTLLQLSGLKRKLEDKHATLGIFDGSTKRAIEDELCVIEGMMYAIRAVKNGTELYLDGIYKVLR